jgi:DnaK suppressor protein
VLQRPARTLNTLSAAYLDKETDMHTARPTMRPTAAQKKDLRHARSRLLAERQRLVERLASELIEPNEPEGPHALADAAGGISAREGSFAFCSVLSKTIEEIDSALQKMDEATYGVCEDCGRHIAAARLRVIPFARLCLKCELCEEQERRTLAEKDGREHSAVMWGIGHDARLAS